jgi:hypothetical protein
LLSEAPRPQGGASQYFFKRAELAEARNPPSPRLRRVVLPFIPVLPHGAFWRRRVKIDESIKRLDMGGTTKVPGRGLSLNQSRRGRTNGLFLKPPKLDRLHLPFRSWMFRIIPKYQQYPPSFPTSQGRQSLNDRRKNTIVFVLTSMGGVAN